MTRAIPSLAANWLKIATVVASVCGLLLAGPAYAAPPENADPALAPWFQGLTQPGTGASCCSIADCRPVRERIIAGHYEAWVDDQYGKDVTPRWVEIPSEVILSRKDNPLGKPVLCWTPSRGPLCYVRGIET